MSNDYNLETLLPLIHAALARSANTRALNLSDEEIIRNVHDILNNQGNISIGDNNVQTIINLVLERVKQRSVQHPIPDISQAVGRASELQQLAAQLDQAATSQVVAAKGVAGIGKSTLAAMYCRDYADKYQFICWRDVRADGVVSGLLLVVAELMGVSIDLRELGANEANHAAALVGLLRQGHALVVVDNCEDLLDAQGNPPSGWELLFAAGQLGASRLLLTSRQQVRAARVPLKVYTIEGLSEADGIKLLQQRGLTDDTALLQRAWDKAGGHPLALILLAGLVTDEGKKLKRLLDEPRLWQGEVATNLLDEVYQRLSEPQQRLLQYVSIYDRADRFRYPVAVAELAGMLAALPAALQPAAEWTAEGLEECALSLSRRSLLISASAGDDERYTLHAIVRDYAYKLLPKPPAHHLAAASYFQQEYRRTHPDARSHPARDLADVQALLNAYDQLLAAQDYEAAATLLNGTPFEYMSGGDWLSLYALLDRWSEFSRGLAMQEQLANAPAGTLLEDSRAAALGNLGVAYLSLGDYRRATQYHSRSLELATRIGDQLGQANALGNLGIAYLSLGDYDKAIDYHSRHLELATTIGDQQGQANALGNLGAAYDSLGDYPKAIDYHTRHLELATKIGDQLGQANALGSLGLVYDSLGDYHKAIDYLTRSLEIKQRIGDQLGQATALGNLGNVYAALAEYPQALDYYQQARAIFARIGANHLVALVERNIANTRSRSVAPRPNPSLTNNPKFGGK